MKIKQILFVVLLLFNYAHIYSQINKLYPAFKALDNSCFKWKEFSFEQPWEKVKRICEIEKIEHYDSDYQNFYCGYISDTTKSYIINNEIYHEFNDISYDQVILHIVGSTTSSFNYSSLYFIKQFSDSIRANFLYKQILNSFKTKYGNCETSHSDNYRRGITTIKGGHLNISDESAPYPSVDETYWQGNNVFLKLSFIKEGNFIMLSVRNDFLHNFNSQSKNWFFESNCDENYNDAFKEFDAKKCYKKLKFGITKTEVKNIIKYKDADILKQYLVTTPEYNNWFDIHFDFCKLTFNKKNKLYDVSLSKDEYSDDDYEQFLKDLIEMFGEPTTYKEKKGDNEFTLWKGMNIYFFVMRPQDKSLYVSFYCVGLDDSSSTDKLY